MAVTEKNTEKNEGLYFPLAHRTESASPEQRVKLWLELCPSSKVDLPKGTLSLTTAEAAFTNPTARPVAPFVKPPLTLDYGLRVYVAPTTFINRNCVILDTPVADVRIGENCNLGPDVSIFSVSHPHVAGPDGKRQSCGKPVIIEDGVWICGNVTILPGVTIGCGATVAAGAVVTKNVPPMTIVAGNPARVVREIDPSEGWTRPMAAETLEECMDL
ncbi:trimeric LpxA-like protein [Plectosphaerella plurivora]|uniref:Trimeric LpxA-like protein n=1 Tax=Plectosphaerella plurivora TaxID=936078 RepID=A0A9P8V2N1_9PEZI|nr:trimeric LpxA-like protein [Plectosphaerella plurivora]